MATDRMVLEVNGVNNSQSSNNSFVNQAGIDENPLNKLEGGYTYYARLTLMHPKNINRLNPKLGKILCETATTGKFILDSVSWDGTVSPNAQTSVAYNTTGEMKIYEPLGVRFLDYIRFAALEVGLMNHFDARFLLEIEIVSEGLAPTEKQYRWAWPIMILATEVKGGVSEKGTEYNIKFVHTGQHAQTDMVQPLKETITVEGVSTIGEYFKNFARELEVQEFIYAKGGQKAGPMEAPGGDNPASSTIYHDEYHFILDPRLEKYTFTTKGPADKGIKGSWTNRLPFTTNTFNISAKGGTTLISQIQRVLSMTNESAQLYLENYGTPAAGPSASQSSKPNADNLRSVLGKIYNFFRIDTHAVYKEFDYIRNRYAVKHIFIIYLALEPTLYQYPDELMELNKPENKSKVITKLKAYAQEGLLRKAYHYQYTGANTEILKFDIQLNQMYYLPSFPVIWTDRGTTGPGPINQQNFNRTIQPFGRYTADEDDRVRLAKEEAEARNLAGRIATEQNSAEKKKLVAQQQKLKEAIEARRKSLSVESIPESAAPLNKNRAELLQSLNALYIEDVDYKSSVEVAAKLTPAHQPRTEPNKPSSILDEKHDENQALTDKIFEVQLAARDLMEIDMDIKGDPFWLGTPTIALAGKQAIDKLELPPAVKDKVNSVLPKLDPDYTLSKVNSWSTYDGAKYYKGGNLFYLNSQLPVNDFNDNDLMQFNEIDQVIGIYKVVKIKNEFKNGKWTQSIHAIRDLTIPSQFLPRSAVGQGFENWVNEVGKEKTRALDTMKSQAAAEKVKVETERIKKLQEQNIKNGTINPIQNSDTNTNTDGGIDVSTSPPAA